MSLASACGCLAQRRRYAGIAVAVPLSRSAHRDARRSVPGHRRASCLSANALELCASAVNTGGWRTP